MRIVILLIIFIFGIPLFLSCEQSPLTPMDYERLRERMVQEQIKERGIVTEAVLNAFRKVPRHLFIPENLRSMAYLDSALPIGEEQTISQPYMVALMTDLLAVTRTDRVLEIGTGSGYQAAILAELGAQVYSIEILDSLAVKAKQLLDTMGYQNITVKTGDGFLGWKEYAPYNAIVVTCATPQIPPALMEQLAENGRLVIPVDVQEGYQKLKKVVKQKNNYIKEDVIDCRFVPMTGENVEKFLNELHKSQE